MTISTFSTGWCFTCDTNACEHVKHLNKNKGSITLWEQ